MPPELKKLVEEDPIWEEFYSRMSSYFKNACELTGKCSIEMGKVMIPDAAIRNRDRAIEMTENSFKSFIRKIAKAATDARDAELMKNIPSEMTLNDSMPPDVWDHRRGRNDYRSDILKLIARKE